MFTQLFGYYLLNNGIVSRPQLQTALEAVSRTKVMLGSLAIEAGYMTAAQVDQVHEQQRRVDKRIGDIAVEMGYLKAEQVSELLAKQRSSDLALGQSLIDLGYLTNSQFEAALSNYRNEANYKTEDASDELLSKDINTIIGIGDTPEDKLFSEYVLLLTRNLVRFVGDDFTFIGKTRADALQCMCSQDLTGAVEAMTAMAADELEFTEFASRYAGEPLTTPEYIQDGICEFLNTQNGLLAVNMSLERDIEISLTPPVCHEGSVSIKTLHAQTVTLLFSFGMVTFILKNK